MTKNATEGLTQEFPDEEDAETELTDEDILDAMQHIHGYLDISTEDFRMIYHLAYRHATERFGAGISAGSLMHHSVVSLQPNMTLDIAAKLLAGSGYKGLPVVAADGCVMGMLTENDFLKYLKVENFMEMLSKMLDDTFEFSHTCHETTVNAAMTQPIVSISRGAGFKEILDAFHRHKGRSMPVVDADGRLLGLLLKKDVFAAYKQKESA